MKYRLHYDITSKLDCTTHGKKELDAETDQELAEKIQDICKAVEERMNKGAGGLCSRFRVKPTRLVKIVQPEIVEEIPFEVL